MSVFKNDCWAAGACTTEMKPVAADVNQPPRRMIELSVALDRATFVEKADQSKGCEQQDLSSQDVTQNSENAASGLMVPCRL